MKISKTALLQGSIWTSAFLWFFQIGFLQLWRSLTLLSTIPLWLGFSLFFLLFFTLSLSLIKTTQSIYINKPNDNFDLNIKDIYCSVFIFIVALASWYIYSLPQLSRPPNTFGDEDWHFKATLAIANYISLFIHGHAAPNAAPEAYRYGDLMYLLLSIPTIVNKNLYFSPFFQRIGLIIPFLLTNLITFICARQLLRNQMLAILFTIVISTSPLLLSFTIDNYLDIGHAPIFLIIMSCLYWGVKKNNIYLLTLAGIFASLAPLVRENAIPTTVLISLFLGLYGSLIYPKNLKWSTLISIITILPFALFYYFKTHYTSIDADRLSILNIFHQDYMSFFKMLFFYLNPFIIILSLFSLLWTDKKTRLIVAFIIASLSGQLLIYALFQPGWIPWSRNYMMFYSQLIFLSLLGISWLHTYSSKFKIVTAMLLILAIIFNCILDKSQLNKNKYFHEIEIQYNYLSFFDYLYNSHDAVKPNSLIYLQVPIATPYSFQYSQEAMRNKHQNPLSVSFKQIEMNHQPAAMENMMTFRQLTKIMPKDAHYILFHWWIPNSKINILSIYPHIPKPTQQELINYKILFENADPGSNGNAGIMLLKKYNTKIIGHSSTI
jgi:hypothetical protein